MISLLLVSSMSLVLLCLMAYQVCGEVLHEWGGVLMTLLLIVHHILNRRWYASLFKGRYNAYRVITVLVNTLLLGCIALTALCGMSMSAHAVPFLYGLLPLSFARQTHLALSFWSFVLMGFHLGLHIPAMTAGLNWNGKFKAFFALLCTAAAGVGFRLFVKNGLPDYMFFRTPFAFLDYDKAALLVFAENLAILIAFALLGSCCANFCKAFGRNTRKGRALLPLLLVLLSVGIAVVLTLCTGGSTEAAPSWEAPKTDSPAAESETARANNPNAATGQSSAPGADDQGPPAELEEGFLLLSGGSFRMGSPETENWRIDGSSIRMTVGITVLLIYKENHTRSDPTL